MLLFLKFNLRAINFNISVLRGIKFPKKWIAPNSKGAVLETGDPSPSVSRSDSDSMSDSDIESDLESESDMESVQMNVSESDSE